MCEACNGNEGRALGQRKGLGVGGGRPSRAVTEGESFDLAQWVCWVLCPIP